MATLLATWIITLITFIGGFILGFWIFSVQVDKPFPIKFPKIQLKKKKIGAIPKISQTELEKKGTRYEATEKAMEETLKEIL